MQISASGFGDHQSDGSGPFEVIAFDCDGVLFDSKEANVRFYSCILEHIGRPPIQPEQQEYIHMHPVRESLRYLVGEGKGFEEAWNYVQSIDFEQFNACLRPEPGLVKLLEQAQTYYHTALATNRTVSTRQVLAHFHIEKYFDLGFGKLIAGVEVENLFDNKNSQIINPTTGRAYEYGDPTPSSYNDPLYPQLTGDISPFPYTPARYLEPRTVRLSLSLRF